MSTRLFVLFKRQCIDSSRNYWLWAMLLIPVLYAVAFEAGQEYDATIMTLPLFMLYGFIGGGIHPALIAEEKEGGRRSLYRVSPVHEGHLLLVKGLFSLVLSTSVSVMIVLISPFPIEHAAMFIGFVLLSSILVVSAGTIAAFYSKNVADTYIKGLPVLLLFLFPPIFAPVVKNELFTALNAMLPGLPVIRLLAFTISGEEGGQFTQDLLVLGSWTLLLFIICLIMYKKRKSL